MIAVDIHKQIDRELALARQARADGLEGKARVCARRAVGIALRDYFSRQGFRTGNQSVVDLIQTYQEQPGLAQEQREICAHLLTRVDPDYRLPIPVDLLAEAHALIAALMKEEK